MTVRMAGSSNFRWHEFFLFDENRYYYLSPTESVHEEEMEGFLLLVQLIPRRAKQPKVGLLFVGTNLPCS